MTDDTGQAGAGDRRHERPGTAAEFFRRRAGDVRPEDLHALLALAPDRPPDPGDELPPGL